MKNVAWYNPKYIYGSGSSWEKKILVVDIHFFEEYIIDKTETRTLTLSELLHSWALLHVWES